MEDTAPAIEKRKLEGISKTSSDFSSYEQVQKPNYRLSESKTGDEDFDDTFKIKTVDFSLFTSNPPEFAKQLGHAMEEIGFVVLTNHGLSKELIFDQANAEVLKLFGEHSVAEKQKFKPRRFGSVNSGYFGMKETTEIHPDLVEGWVFTRNLFGMDQPELKDDSMKVDIEAFWPSMKHEKVFRVVLAEVSKLVVPIMQSVLRYLKAPDIHAFDGKLGPPSQALRLNYYPPVSNEDDSSGAGRLLGHEDVTLFTLLPTPLTEGLQVLNRRNMKWIRLEAPPGSIVLNTGDYLQRISNDILPSTTHRVSKPRDKSLMKESRVSVVINNYLHHTDTIEVLPHLENRKYEPMKVLEFHTKITSKFYGDTYAVVEENVEPDQKKRKVE